MWRRIVLFTIAVAAIIGILVVIGVTIDEAPGDGYAQRD